MKYLIVFMCLLCLGCEQQKHQSEIIGTVVSIEQIESGPKKLHRNLVRGWVVIEPGNNHTATVQKGKIWPKVGEKWLCKWGEQRHYNDNTSAGSVGYVFITRIE